ncbi:hypothetical protein ELI02_04655 [Rhizobium leguminosarum]|uniref:hypothetical protein n=1 Tax=Rhizobium leguminosarum TaxID=384 RepID=UPI0010312253|nr:hypothetical protein [Rhizobium leguminosarum]TAX59362.1 hypothetical protein ELI02_04655 [Rhizobium leguminosarum]
MDDASASGRQALGATSSPLAFGSMTGKPTDQPLDEQHAGLDRRSALLSFIAQGFAFVAFMLVFAAACIRPSDPADLRMLDGSVYVLDAFTNALALTDVKSGVVSVGTELMPFTRLAQMVACILTLSAVFTIIKGRWFFAGLAAAFFLIPWGLFGQSLYFAPYALALFAFIAVAFHASLSRRAIIAFVAVSVLASPLIIGLISDLSRRVGVRETYAKYRVIRVSDLPSSAYQPSADAEEDQQTSSQSDGNAKIAPFFLAQVHALRGDTVAAAAALDELEASGVAQNNFDRARFEAIRNFTLASGGFGPDAREKLIVDNAARSQRAFLLFLAALLFGIAAPLTNGFSWLVARRSRRVFSIERELERRRANLPDALKSAGGLFGTHIAKKSVQSSSVASGERAIEAIASRARAYLLLSLGLLAFAALSALAAYWVWLPDAEKNTAFHLVALAGNTADYAQQDGIAVIVGVRDWAGWSITLNWLKYPICIVAIVLATRRSRYLGAFTAMAFLACFALQNVQLAQHSRREALPSQFSQLLRSKLKLAAHRSNSAFGNVSQPTTGGLQGLALNLRGSIAAEKNTPSSVGTVDLNSSLAAYTLAQIAYLEGEAADASHFLSQIEDVRDLHPDIHRERMAIIRDWVSANGHTPPETEWFSADFASLVRQLGRWLLTLSVASLALAVLVTPLIAVAVARRNRIEALIEERGRYEL